jgi:hypothetical protein
LYHNFLKIIVKELQEERKTQESRDEHTTKRVVRHEYYFQSAPWVTRMTKTCDQTVPSTTTG